MNLRSTCITLLASASMAAPVAAHAADDVTWMQPTRPATFAPAGGFANATSVAVFTAYGRGAYIPIRVQATCGAFDSGGSELVVISDGDGRATTNSTWRAPAQAAECEMIFSEVENDFTSLSVLVHVYDAAKVTMTTNFGETLQTQASRPFETTLTFYTEQGLPIVDNLVLPMVSKNEGASATDLYISYPTTTADGIQYVSGLANNAVGEYDLIVELQYAARWRIPVYQGVPLPAARKHFGPM